MHALSRRCVLCGNPVATYHAATALTLCTTCRRHYERAANRHPRTPPPRATGYRAAAYEFAWTMTEADDG